MLKFRSNLISRSSSSIFTNTHPLGNVTPLSQRHIDWLWFWLRLHQAPELHELKLSSTPPPWHLALLFSGCWRRRRYGDMRRTQSSRVVSFNTQRCRGVSRDRLFWAASRAASSPSPFEQQEEAPATPARREMIESPGIWAKNRERSSHKTAGQYQNRQRLLFTHHHLQATPNWPRKRKPQQKTGAKKKKKKHIECYSDLRLCFNETVSKCKGKRELAAQLFINSMARGSSAAVHSLLRTMWGRGCISLALCHISAPNLLERVQTHHECLLCLPMMLASVSLVTVQHT